MPNDPRIPRIVQDYMDDIRASGDADTHSFLVNPVTRRPTRKPRLTKAQRDYAAGLDRLVNEYLHKMTKGD